MQKCLIGFGGHAREVMAQMEEKLLCFVDDEYVCENSLPLSKFNPSKYFAMIAIGDSSDRKKVKEKLPNNTKFFTFIHPTAQIMDNNNIGEGSFIGANTIITTNVKLGKHTILNRAVQIGHDCQIKDYFSAMPGVVISGNVKIGEKVYFGTNSSAKERISICNNVIIGLNGGVVKNIDKSGVYVGVPVKKIR